jgi:hypothetical protein
MIRIRNPRRRLMFSLTLGRHARPRFGAFRDPIRLQDLNRRLHNPTALGLKHGIEALPELAIVIPNHKAHSRTVGECPGDPCTDAAHVLFTSGDAWRAGARDSGARGPSGSHDDAAVYAPESRGARQRVMSRSSPEPMVMRHARSNSAIRQGAVGDESVHPCRPRRDR